MSEELSPAKKALLERWLKGNFPSEKSMDIPRRNAADPIQLSFSQQRQLFLELLDRNTAVNNLSVLLELKGYLDVQTLIKSANKIVERHEVLRTQFVFDGGMPSVMLVPDLKLTIPVIETQDNSSNLTALKKNVLNLVEREVLEPFNLTQAPLLRLKLYKLKEDLHQFLIVIHHTIADGWSLGVFLTELMSIYNSIHDNRPSSLDPLPVQYYDFTQWLRDDKQVNKWEPELEYWKDKLKGELPLLELPTDEVRGARQSYTGGTYNFTLSKETTHALEQLSKHNDVTLFMTLLCAFNILLHRYSDQEEILVGTPVANRNLQELEGLIGVFINILVLRTDLSDAPNFLTALDRIKRTATEGYAHQNIPFERLVEELKPKRDLSRTPLFQVMFNLQSSPRPKLEIQGIESSFVEMNRGVSQFDLTLMITKQDGECLVDVEYNSDLFRYDTVKRMFHSFHLILEAIIQNPESAIAELPLATEGEIEELIQKYNRSEIAFPAHKRMHELFEERAKEFPERTAVIFNERNYSYAAINARANKLGRHLAMLGVNEGVRVGILMDRSNEMLEAMLAIHKAGGTYIPINGAYPIDRIQFILKDAEIKVLVTNKEPLNSFSQMTTVNPAEVLNTLDIDDANLFTPRSANDLAYIIYTSGSTGEPKGVMINHSSLTNFLVSMQREPGIEMDDILLAVTNSSFDISALELYLPLITGATVVIASEEMMLDPRLLAESIQKYKVSMLQATPALWQLLIDAGWTGKHDMKALCGGDVLSKTLARQLLKKTGSLWNMYGPTETTIWSSMSKVSEEDKIISIGHPIQNTQLFILDKLLQPLPLGIEGELYISGSGLAEGYLNNPSLTTEKFVTSPFIQQGAVRLYKTGDKARFLHDRSIQLFGRSDDQIKLNGHRIELGEITAAILHHPLVSNAITVMGRSEMNQKYLSAYYVSPDGPDSMNEDLKSYLRTKLPVYMVPQYVVRLETLPLTSSGKIDRKQLPQLLETAVASDFVAPRNEQEEILVEIWQNVLHVERVGIHDNFFELGGASIQAIQVVTKANMFGYSINIEHLFEHQTIAELGEFIQAQADHG